MHGNKPFWRYIKSRRLETSHICHKYSYISKADSLKAEALNKAFKSVFTIEDLHSLPFLPDSTHPTMHIHISLALQNKNGIKRSGNARLYTCILPCKPAWCVEHLITTRSTQSRRS